MLLDIFDPKAAPRAIGIDLGTTNSVVAFVQDGQPQSILTCDGTPGLPSVVYYGPAGEVRVGRAALAQSHAAPERTLASVKRFMGRSASDPQTQALGSYRFALPTNEQQARVVRFDVGERLVTPVEVSAEILASLKRSADEKLRQVGGVVVTVPAYFDDAQRQATKDAAALAGLQLLRLLNEPTAAALAYGLQRGLEGLYAVYDLGGGTFDVTVLELSDGVFQVKSTGGDSALGGDDMDRAIAERWLGQAGISTGPDLDRSVITAYLSAARRAKHELSSKSEAHAQLPGLRGKEQSFQLTRGEFEQLIEPLLERTARVCRRALRDAGTTPGALQGVILVGGATHVPAVRRFVEALFGRTPLAEIDPELVVAYGAALQAHELSQEESSTLLLDVLPLSLGIETMGGTVDRILPRNTTIPVSATATFTTYADHQTGFELHVVQGERELAKDCRSLARFTLRGIPPLPAGQARLEVTFDVDENSQLTVRARELTTGLAQQVVVQPTHGLTDEEVEAMLLAALDHGESDLERRRQVEAHVEGSRVLQSTWKALRADADLLSQAEQDAITQAAQRLERALMEKATADKTQALTQQLEDATHAFAGRRMDRAFQSALSGHAVDAVMGSVKHARGVEAHLAEHAATRGQAPSAAVTITPEQEER